MNSPFTIHPFLPSHPRANLLHETTCELAYRLESGDRVTFPKGTVAVEIGVVIDDEDPASYQFMAAKINGVVYPVPYEMTICLRYG